MKEEIIELENHEKFKEVIHVLFTSKGYQIKKAKDEKKIRVPLNYEISLII